MKWDGEWHITYETFRDMGMAFGIAMLLIYLLIVGQFQSFLTPIIIMAQEIAPEGAAVTSGVVK